MRRPSRLAAAGAIATAIALAGCATAPSTPGPAAPQLTLLDAATLEIPRDCEVRGGAIYRTSFTVEPGGNVGAIESQDSREPCVEQALTGWVATFRYAPVAEPTPTVIDWMATVARR